MARVTEPVLLGDVEVPSGILVVLDPGLGRFWRHDGDPASPRPGDPAQVDLHVVGPDARAAEPLFGGWFESGHRYDVRADEVDRLRERYTATAAERGLRAWVEPLPARVPHTRRARLAVAGERGAGLVTYNGLWAVAIAGLPTDRPLPVLGTPMPDGEFAGRWRAVDVLADPTAHVAATHVVEGVMVEHGQLACFDLDALGEFRMWESLDGLADLVFSGPDAAELATTVGATTLGDGEFGWKDLPDADISARAQHVQRLAGEQNLRVYADYRPHDNLERLNAQIRTADTRAGVLTLAGSHVCGFANRWGDGIFTVTRDVDAAGRLVRVRLDVGNEDTQHRMLRVRLLASGAVVSHLVWTGEQPPRFLQRSDPRRAEDSGWLVSSGAEPAGSMADHFQIVQVGHLVDRFPAFKQVVDAPPGSLFRLENDAYVPD